MRIPLEFARSEEPFDFSFDLTDRIDKDDEIVSVALHTDCPWCKVGDNTAKTVVLTIDNKKERGCEYAADLIVTLDSKAKLVAALWLRSAKGNGIPWTKPRPAPKPAADGEATDDGEDRG